jgi:hypothetical protein
MCEQWTAIKRRKDTLLAVSSNVWQTDVYVWT